MLDLHDRQRRVTGKCRSQKLILNTWLSDELKMQVPKKQRLYAKYYVTIHLLKKKMITAISL